MNSEMAVKIEKGIKYSYETDRFEFTQLKVNVRGAHRVHPVEFDEGTWKCNCEFFITHQQCSHTIAVEKLLGPHPARRHSPHQLTIPIQIQTGEVIDLARFHFKTSRLAASEVG